MTREDFVRILSEPENALIRQYRGAAAHRGVRLQFTPDAVEAIAEIASQVNQRAENIGARRLYTIMEKLLDEVSFEAPSLVGREIVIDAEYVHARAGRGPEGRGPLPVHPLVARRDAMATPDMQRMIHRAEVLLEALPYLQAFQGKTIVIKYGGSAMETGGPQGAVRPRRPAAPAHRHPSRHRARGRPQIGALMKKLGKEPHFVGGMRVTDTRPMELVEMVLVGKINKEIVGLINRPRRPGGGALRQGRQSAPRAQAAAPHARRDPAWTSGWWARWRPSTPSLIRLLEDNGLHPGDRAGRGGRAARATTSTPTWWRARWRRRCARRSSIHLTDVQGINGEDGRLISTLDQARRRAADQGQRDRRAGCCPRWSPRCARWRRRRQRRTSSTAACRTRSSSRSSPTKASGPKSSSRGESGGHERAPRRGRQAPDGRSPSDSRSRSVRGEGMRVWDSDGKEYLDFTGGIAVTALGHSHPRVVGTIREQATTLLHVSNLFHIPQQTHLAKLLCDHSFADRVFFGNSGAEANEAAIKLARKWAKEHGASDRGDIITMRGGFHGRTLATVTATAQEKYHHGYEPLPGGFKYVPYNDLRAVERAHRQPHRRGDGRSPSRAKAA